tara:strand:+ start:440 stop:685 length:246 start_codon:yes stop_codon:yes gene_type:complete
MSEDEIQSYLEMVLDREKVEEDDDGTTVVRTKTGTTIVSGGNITINGKKITKSRYNPRDYDDSWRRQYNFLDPRRYDQSRK